MYDQEKKKANIYNLYNRMCWLCKQPWTWSFPSSGEFKYLDSGYMSFGWIPGISFSFPVK